MLRSYSLDIDDGYEIILPQVLTSLYNKDTLISHLLKFCVQFDKALRCIHPKQLRKTEKLYFTYTCLHTSETTIKYQ